MKNLIIILCLVTIFAIPTFAECGDIDTGNRCFTEQSEGEIENEQKDEKTEILSFIEFLKFQIHYLIK